jgi:hypothetical protein
VTLAYLDVPIVNAPLFATALVLQAALGTWCVTKLLKGVQPSLLMLVGPGLILGGAVSFAIFQVVGRGVVGVVITTLAGLGSFGLLMRSAAPEVAIEPRWWMLGQICGLGALAITPEFGELLPVAATLFGLGFLTNRAKPRVGRFALIGYVVGAVVIVAAFFLRQDYWWLVTDDYLMLEVIARHLTIEGPFKPWGVNSFLNYHWLSYGWSGLLDLLGGSPEPLVTLTRVMPILYSLSMASSLTLIAKRLRASSVTMIAMISVWAVVAVGRFEWTGTSTGGVYAVLSAVFALNLVAERSKKSQLGAVTLLILSFLIVTFTKLPSIFLLLLGLLMLIPEVVSALIGESPLVRYGRIVGLIAAGPIVILTVWAFGNYLDGRIRLTTMNPGLGQLAFTGRPFVGPTLLLNQLWLWTCVGFALWSNLRARGNSLRNSSWLIVTSSVSLLCALVLEMSLSGATNTYTYFSGPFYFVASFSILVIGSQVESKAAFDHIDVILTVTLVIVGLIWILTDVSTVLWNTVGLIVDINDPVRIELLKFFTSDGRFGIALVATIFFLIFFITSQASMRVVFPFLLALCVMTMYGLSPGSRESIQNEVSWKQVTTDLGSESQREIGEWLHLNTNSRDLIATNYLFEETAGSVSDYALAVWAQREFLVLGPQLGYGTTPARSEAFALSRSFSDEPSEFNCAQLATRDVRWFVIDDRLTSNRDWSVCAEQAFSDGNFVVLRLIQRT